MTSTKNARLASPAGVNSSTGPRWAISLTSLLPRPRRAARRARRTAARTAAARAWRPPWPRGPATPRAPRRARSAATTVAPSASSTTRSPGRISWPPTTTGTSSSPTASFVAPRERTQRAHTGRPIAPSSSLSRTAASTSTAAAPRTCACVASRSPIRATGAGSGIDKTSTSPGCSAAIAAWTIRLSSWPQRAIRAGPQAREPGTSCRSSTSTSPCRPDGLVDRRGPQPGELGGDAHSSSTTCGTTRWNDSP